MGRLEPPADLLTPETAAPPAPASPPPLARPARQVRAPRLTLMLAPVLTGAGTLALVLASVPAPAMEPGLVRLLHGMVLIKGLIGLVAGGLVYWRFGRPVASPLALGYVACLCLGAGALGWLWGLALVPLGSALFWGSLIGLALVARRDPLLSAVGTRRPGPPIPRS